MSERTKFIVEWERRRELLEGRSVNVAELCRMFGVSRQTGYVWIRRYIDAGGDLRVLDDRSRRPRSNPRALSEKLEDFIVEARRRFPTWGPVVLRSWLVNTYPRHSFPSASCIGSLLKRRGLTASKRRTRNAKSIAVTPPFKDCTGTNDIWCMDFKGSFRMKDGNVVYPFTLLDAHSRLLLRCQGMLHPTGEAVMSVLDSAFREYGLPRRIRSDGGPPFFAAGSPATLSRLSIWLLRLGITLECIAPAKPQQNGRLERFHGTLKKEVKPASGLAQQQRGFDDFRRVYNFERPHRALSLAQPWTVYRRSPRKYPRALFKPNALPEHIENVDNRGFIHWRRKRIFIGEAFSNESITFWPMEGTRWLVHFGSIVLGEMDETLAQPFAPTKRPKGCMKLSIEETDAWIPMKTKR